MPKAQSGSAKLEVSSTAFGEGQPIPIKYTCDGEDISPSLTVAHVPDGTKSLALICEDPDAPRGTWVHWVMYGIPTDTSELPESVPPTETIQGGARQGRNDFGRIGYGGPCPPPGPAHRYFFRFYAVDSSVDLQAGATKKDLLAAINGHTVAEGALMGTYNRR